VFVFRGRRGDMIKVLWWTGDGLCLLAKRLEKGRFVWPQASSGSVALDAGAAVDAARRDRLAAAGAHLGANVGLVNAPRVA
jgi:transposase